MNKLELESLDLTIYHETLNNGLNVYIVPFKNTRATYATLTTKFGSIHTEFVKDNQLFKVPNGIAHFLEHQMFEQEDTNPFTLFTNNGADANAYTSYFQTTYLFDATEKINENVEILLNYVQKPFFTDKSVEKEKGIIIQELNMYKDNPYSVLKEQILNNLFINHHAKYPVGGLEEDVLSITKEDLYLCYETFYHPSNMILVITGNIDTSIVDLIKENQNKKEFKDNNYQLKEIIEPNHVYKEYEELKLNNVSIPKTIIAYKINSDEFNMDKQLLANYLEMIFTYKVGSTSLFNQALKDKSLITDDIFIDVDIIDNFIIISTIFESHQYKEVINKIEVELKHLSFTLEELERRKKALISNVLYGSDSHHFINNKIVDNLITYNKILTDTISKIKGFNLKEASFVTENINLNNKAICVITNK